MIPRINRQGICCHSRHFEGLWFAMLSILLLGLVLNASLGWWWADPVAALAMVPIIAKEGSDALRGRTCCAACP